MAMSHKEVKEVIHSPGKFEGELACVPAMWDIAMEGLSADVFIGETQFSFVNTACITEDGLPIAGLFGAVLWEDSNGFVHSEWFDTEQEYDAGMARLEAEAEQEADSDEDEDEDADWEHSAQFMTEFDPSEGGSGVGE